MENLTKESYLRPMSEVVLIKLKSTILSVSSLDIESISVSTNEYGDGDFE